MVVVRACSRPASWVLGLLLAGSGCGFEGELPTPATPPRPPVPPTQAGIALSLSSSPIEVVVGANGGAWRAEWTLGIQETSGIGGAIDSVHATLTEPSGAAIAETGLDAGEVSQQLGGSNHIQGGSNQKILMGLDFDFPSDVPSGNLRVAVQLSDDRGHAVSSAVDDVVQVCVPRLLAPNERAILDNGCTNGANGILWEFDWSDCAGAASYQVYVRQRSAQEPLFDRPELTSSSFTVLESRIIPEESRLGWFWRVRANVNGVWGGWSPERTFDVEPANTDCVRP
jgi:hypothetical protein